MAAGGIELTTRFQAARDVVARDVPDGMMLVDVQTGAAFKLNRVGAQVWRQLDGVRVLGDILAGLEREYGVARDELRRDVEALIGDLEKQGLAGRAADVK